MSSQWSPSAMSGEPDETAREVLGGWLARRGLHGEFTETHVSVLALTDDRVFKMKKPVRFPFLDLSTPRRREEVCRSEVELNRRISPDVYLGVRDVTDEAGDVVDHAVEMVRMPDDRRLSTLLEQGAAGQCVERVGRLVARFHASCTRSPAADEAGSWEGARHLWEMARDQTEPFVGRVLDEKVAREVIDRAERFLAGRHPLFDARVAAGRACDGHGDLLADDIFCLEDGPRVLDCLEFDAALRYGDVLADVAFLAMDLERRGHPEAARRFLDVYTDAAGDRWPRSLEHHWIAYRAHVRAKIACFRTEHGDEQAARHAGVDLELARSHLRAGAVRLVLVGGAPGTGKSTLASGIAAARGWALLRSDELRSEVVGPGDATRPEGLDEGRYRASARSEVYDEMSARAEERLRLGETVVLDASWSRAVDRDTAARLARSTDTDLISIRTDAPASVADARIGDRADEGGDVSEATPEIAAAMRERFDPWPDAAVVETVGPVATTLARALDICGPA